MYLLDLLTGLLPSALRPYAKALFPSIGTAVGVGVQWVATGTFDKAELTTAITGACTALVTFLIPNRPAKPATIPPDEDNSALQAVDGDATQPVAPDPASGSRINPANEPVPFEETP